LLRVASSEPKRCSDKPSHLSAVEHPFRVLKRQFGFAKVRYRGLFKNEQHLFTRFALVNLCLAKTLFEPA